MPPPGPDGQVIASHLPDFISVAGPDGGIVGYAPSNLLVPDPNAPDRNIPVYGTDLTTIVGYLIPGRGFVALGSDPDTLPTTPIGHAGASPSLKTPDDEAVAVYVRNEGSTQHWIATITAGAVVDAQGYVNGLAFGCVSVGIGTQLVLLSGPPQEPGVHPVRTLSVGGAGAPDAVSIEISASGTIISGTGLPAWWPQGPVAC